MANPEHLKILKQGVEVWNRWREENQGIKPDLSDANLQDAFLTLADLRDANLTGANLERAVLRHLARANLTSANLGASYIARADVSDAILVRSRLAQARLVDVDLQSADLRGANLSRANLVDVNLSGANFMEAHLDSTSVGSVDLSGARNLNLVRHRFASHIATDTLARTAQGLLQLQDFRRRQEVETFLRGAGVPEIIMHTFAAMAENPIEFFSCFISYSHSNKSLARRLYDQLQARGIRCWLDEHDLKPGDRILDVIDDAIRLHDKILLCCSADSLNSWWVKDEIRKAMERERHDGRDIIIPLMVDRYLLDGWEDGLAADLRSRLAADFTGWEHDNAKFEEQLERVVKALRTDEGARAKAPESKL